MWLLYSTMAVFAGAILDFLFGDINVWWHPICLIGKLISATEKMIRRNIADVKSDEEKIIRMERQGGVVFSIIVMAISSLVPCIALLFTYKINVVVGFILESLLCWFMLAARCLYKESMKVGIALENEGLEAGRTAVSMIVGRDTADLSEEGVIKATVETVAENTSDGVIAPLFYMLIGGASLGFLYKSINTMDSMVGYKNDKYINFGRFAAKTDDVVNFIPSRLGGLFMILAAALGGYNAKNAARIFGRDRKKHASPNSANTESVMAEALAREFFRYES